MKPEKKVNVCKCREKIRDPARLLFLWSGIGGMLLLSGCTTPGYYKLTVPPTENTKAFKQVEVTEVKVGDTQDRVDSATAGELRKKLIEEIQKKRLYESVTLEGVGASGLEIQPTIVNFRKGSQAARYFLGNLADNSFKARMDVECKFINKETGQTIAQGLFVGEIEGGLFGGSPNQITLSLFLAQHVANFLAKGR